VSFPQDNDCVNHTDMAKLVVISEGFTGKTVELKADKIIIGRSEDNSFQIPEGSVSSHHCELSLKGEAVQVKDLGSTNGTFINDKKITEGTLTKGREGTALALVGPESACLQAGLVCYHTTSLTRTLQLPHGPNCRCCRNASHRLLLVLVN
jgi:hypothetical protein